MAKTLVLIVMKKTRVAHPTSPLKKVLVNVKMGNNKEIFSPKCEQKTI